MKRNEYLKAIAGIIFFFLFFGLLSYFYLSVFEKSTSFNNLINFCRKNVDKISEKDIEELEQSLEELSGISGYLYLNIFHPLACSGIRKDIKKLQKNIKPFKKIFGEFFAAGFGIVLFNDIFGSAKNYRKLKVLIYERFDSDSDGRGYYNAADMTNSRKIVIVGNPETVRKYLDSYYNLYLNYLGEFPFQLTYTYGYSTFKKKVYYETYQLLDNQKLAADYLKLYNEKKKEIEKLKKDYKQKDSELKNFFIQHIKPINTDILKLLGEK